jgi:uncharacterized LabA/DUF88 family protein
MDAFSVSAKVGVFVDVSNVYMNGGGKMRFDVLRQYAQAYGSVIRLNAYVTYDGARAEEDLEYKDRARGFHEAIRSIGYYVHITPVKWFTDPDTNRRFGKANADMNMAIDVILQAPHLDMVFLLTGDGDFVRPIQALRNMGCRVQVIAFDNVSRDLREEADTFVSGYLIPELIPTNRRETPWGVPGSTVRGLCYYHQNSDGYGFLAFLKESSPLTWISDPRQPNSPYKAVFFHDSSLPLNVIPAALPNRYMIFEFEVGEGERGLIAENMRLVG